MTRGRVLFLHPSLRERASLCRVRDGGVWRFRELFLRREGLSVQVGRGFHDHAGGARLMTGRAGAAMRCSCPGRRGHGEGKGDGFVPQSGGSGSATGAVLVPQAAEQRGPVSVRGLRARQEFPGRPARRASFADFVPCAACRVRFLRLTGVFRGVFPPALAGGAAQKGKARGALCVHKIKHNEFQ